MKITSLTFIACLLISCNSTNENTVAVNSSITAPDDAAIKKAVDDAYSAISFEEGGHVAYDSIHYFFIPQAQLINFTADTAQILSINDFVKAYKNYVEKNNVTSFREEEIYGRTDQFGNIAQRISTYKTFVNRTDMPAERGVNSFQLIKTPAGWRVSSITWDIEDKDLQIPKYYLPQ